MTDLHSVLLFLKTRRQAEIRNIHAKYASHGFMIGKEGDKIVRYQGSFCKIIWASNIIYLPPIRTAPKTHKKKKRPLVRCIVGNKTELNQRSPMLRHYIYADAARSPMRHV